jgi:hypothetical protein
MARRIVGRELDLVLQPAADRHHAVLDELLQAGGDLEVQRHRARAVQRDVGHEGPTDRPVGHHDLLGTQTLSGQSIDG